MKFWKWFRWATGLGFVLVMALALWPSDPATDRTCDTPHAKARCMPTIR